MRTGIYRGQRAGLGVQSAAEIIAQEPPDSADDLDRELHRASTQQQMLNIAARAIQRCRRWERYEEHHGRETP